jgi:hypothetical protein
MRRATSLLLLPVSLGLCLAGCAPVDDQPPAVASARVPAPTPVPTASVPPDAEPIAQPHEASGLQGRVEAAISQVQQRDLQTTNSFWTVFHGILGIGPTCTLHDPLTNRRVNAIEYIRTGGEIRGLEFIPTNWGLDVRTGPQFVGQGHQDQFIAEMGQWGMPIDTKFVVHGKEYTYRDFVNHTKMRARVTQNQELSWAIIVIGQYLGTDLHWTNGYGEDLRYEDLVRYELDQPVDSAACGGTHRLFGLTWVYYLHRKRGGTKTGVWKDVAAKIADYEDRAHHFQNPDGSFSTRYLAGPDNVRDPQIRIGTTGHVLEWLSLALPDSELHAPWMEDAANALALMILEAQGTAVESGALYHAAHGLRLYHDRAFAPSTEKRETFIPLPPES